MIALLIDGSVPVVIGVLVLVARGRHQRRRRSCSRSPGARRIDVQWVGKAGTLALMFALPSFLSLDHTYATWHVIGLVVGWGFTIGGLILSYYAASGYVPIARAALRDGKTVPKPSEQVPA